MPKKLTQEEFEIRIHNIDPSFRVIGKYNGYYDENGKPKKILLEHKCGYQDEYAINKFMAGKCKCRKCNNLIPITQKEFESKIDSNIKIIGKFTGLSKRIKCHCKICNHEWSTQAYVLYKHGCPVCRGVKKTNKMFVAEVNNKFPGQYEILTEYQSAVKKVKVKNLQCGHEFECNPRDLLNGECKCPYCNGKRVLVGFNDLWTVNPTIAKFLENPAEGYELTNSSAKEVWWKCSCGNRIHKTVYEVTDTNSLKCPICSDGYPIGEKIIYSLLSHQDIEFDFRIKFDWSCNKQYDFYIPKYKTIVEVNGIQHYKENTKFTHQKLEDIQNNDQIKYDLALRNGISHYIYIDASTSNIFDIVNNIKESALIDILNLQSLTDSDWDEVVKRSMKSIVVEVSDLWNEGLCISEIQNMVKIDRHTIRNYLNRASQIHMCDYNTEESRKRIWRNYAS